MRLAGEWSMVLYTMAGELAVRSHVSTGTSNLMLTLKTPDRAAQFRMVDSCKYHIIFCQN